MVDEPTWKANGSAPVSEMAQLAKFLMKIGPDIDLIARLSGQYKETIRYRYKEKILGRGFQLQARLNFERMGLRRVIMVIKLGKEYSNYAKEVFAAMNRLCYVTSFASLLPEGSYMVHSTVPEEFREAFVALVEQVRDMGVFTSVEFYNFDWFRNVQMRAEYYNFDQGTWEFDWDKHVEYGRDDHEGVYPPFKVDKIDLLIMKELQVDSTRSLSEVREAIMAVDGIDINYKTLAWHWIKHVQEKRMISGYVLRWTGTGYSTSAERIQHRKHRYVIIPVLVRSVTAAERVRLMAETNKVPFVWSEAAGDDYYAQFAFPLEMVNDAFSFLMSVLGEFGDRASYHVVDQSNSAGFTMSYPLFDEVSRKWTFDKEDTTMRFQNLMVKIRESSGGSRNSV